MHLLNMARRCAGNPGGRSSIPNGVKRRMMLSGFVNVKWIDTCQGMLGIKP